MSKILTQAQAEAVYSAMCALNNVGGRLTALIAANGKTIRVEEVSDGSVVMTDRHGRLQYARHADQSAFATAYGLDEATVRAQMVIEGNHPWIGYDLVLLEYGLDDSFQWTAKTLSPYVEQYLQQHKGGDGNDT